MLRPRHLIAPFALACAVLAAPAATQGLTTSITDQLQQQALHDVLRAQHDAALRSVVIRRSGAGPEGAAKPLPPLRMAALEDSVARYERLHRQNRRWSHSLLAVGAAAVAGGFVSSVSGESPMGLSELQRALIVGGFGITVIGAEQRKAAGRAQAQAEQWRIVHLATQRPRR